jgi:hypothetical protein
MSLKFYRFFKWVYYNVVAQKFQCAFLKSMADCYAATIGTSLDEFAVDVRAILDKIGIGKSLNDRIRRASFR